MTPTIVSLNLAERRQFTWRGQSVWTGIYKKPTEAEVRVEPEGLEGDWQADLRVHGGPNKAVYVYPAEHYGFWKNEYPELEMPPGMFGENLTVTGLSESEVRIGDEYRAGTARVRVVQPRQPCFKLGLKFGDPGVLKRFLRSGRSGFYLAVVEPGRLRAGDSLALERRSPEPVTVLDLVAVARKSASREQLGRVVEAEAVPPNWREQARQMLLDGNGLVENAGRT
jgi:MOSC domain-containing protein YiiM